MQKIAYITGTSKGIGRAIAELLIEKNYIVYGLSRTNTIKHPKFYFIKIDLSQLKELESFAFPKFENSDILLINNAARIGNIIPLNLKKDVDIITDYNLNIIAPTILCAKFINCYNQNKKIIINISSGAANNSIASWSTYCASKSALDRLTNVIAEEEHLNLTAFSFHPGVVDTDMQKQIRNSDFKLFPLFKKFNNYYTNNELENTRTVAEKVHYVIKNYSKFDQNVILFRDLNIK